MKKFDYTYSPLAPKGSLWEEGKGEDSMTKPIELIEGCVIPRVLTTFVVLTFPFEGGVAAYFLFPNSIC